MTIDEVHSPLCSSQFKVSGLADGGVGADAGDGELGVVVVMVLVRTSPNLFGCQYKPTYTFHQKRSNPGIDQDCPVPEIVIDDKQSYIQEATYDTACYANSQWNGCHKVKGQQSCNESDCYEKLVPAPNPVFADKAFTGSNKFLFGAQEGGGLRSKYNENCPLNGC